METTTFAELPLGAKLQAAIEAAGYTTPTPIQAQAIPVAVTGQDVLGIAQTGTGKTASFTLPMIQRLETGRARARMPRSLILAPTRELAAQVAQSFEKYGINHKLSVALLIGGVSFDDQERKLDRGADVLIATPGRMIDHFQRGKLLLTGVEILVIDEADRMLDMGFIPDIERICKLLPPRRQTLFFSATMPPEIQRLVDQFLKTPARIEVARPATTAKTITQRFRFCDSTEDWEKREVLRDLIRTHPVKNAIIFCNRKRDVAILHKSLTKHGFNAGALHGDMDQKSRTETLDRFRSGDIMLLAASDVAARGLDIPDVSHIFNFDIPWAGDDYVHRIGRTGRAGKEGIALSLVTPDDLKLLSQIEQVTGETPTWIGEGPSEEDFANAGKRRGRGRGGAKSASDRRGAGRSSERGRRQDREERTERAPRAEASTTAPKRPRRVPASAGSEAAENSIPGLGEQPAVASARPSRDGERSRGTRPSRDEGAPGESSRTENRRGESRRGESDVREDSRARGERPARNEARARGASPAREDGRARSDNSSRGENRGRGENQQLNASARRGGSKGEGRQRQSEQRRSEPASGGFADNIPAFLRRPVKPVKAVATE